MKGLMQDYQLTISSLITFADLYHGDVELVSRTIEGPIHRYTYHEAHMRSKKVAKALLALGAKQGDRVATLAWNGYRHLELYFGISGIGAVLHTINPRLFPEQIIYIANHAEDQYLFVDLTFMPLIEAVADKLKTIKGFIVMTDEAHMPQSKLTNLLCYETLVGQQNEDYAWPKLEENTASSLCYTSGTTGNPKGVLYSHRSTVLHSFCVCTFDGLGMNSREIVLPVVPMFHANAWGTPYAAAMCGAKMVFPGMRMDGEAIYELLDTEKVSLTLAVPTVWLMLLQYLQSTGKKLPYLNRVVIGGSAAPKSMIETFEKDYNVEVIHAWGMTETSPLGTTGNLKPKHADLPYEEKLAIKSKQGRAVYGVDLKIADREGKELPRDGKAFGHLMVRGPWIASGYMKGEGGQVLDAEGWFDTGDVSTLDPDGYMQITDRSKDVIKSGGEWISSIDLENDALGHPAVAEAAVIGVFHPKWDERPLLIVVKKKDVEVTKEEILDYMKKKVAKWQVPDDVVFVDQLPHTATGKLLKTKLRDDFKDFKLA
ncbi:MAG TPA: 3-(methylthio)propionyl-CoA ligase [Thermodesulfobacteriota bacterium]|nr:3-(methylthio)propionyl-CoA ligase [Thermodesulfobacteriota bacterium]